MLQRKSFGHLEALELSVKRKPSPLPVSDAAQQIPSIVTLGAEVEEPLPPTVEPLEQSQRPVVYPHSPV